MHKSGTTEFPEIKTLKEKLTIMREDSNKYSRENGEILNQTLFLNYLDKMVIANMLNAGGISANYPALPPVIGQLN
jgi:hypothetical protein